MSHDLGDRFERAVAGGAPTRLVVRVHGRLDGLRLHVAVALAADGRERAQTLLGPATADDAAIEEVASWSCGQMQRCPVVLDERVDAARPAAGEADPLETSLAAAEALLPSLRAVRIECSAGTHLALATMTGRRSPRSARVEIFHRTGAGLGVGPVIPWQRWAQNAARRREIPLVRLARGH